MFLSHLFLACGCAVNWPGTDIYLEKSELAPSQAGIFTCSRGPHCASASRDMVRATFSTHRSGEDWSVWKSFSQSKPCSERLFTSNKQSPVAQHTEPAFASTGLCFWTSPPTKTEKQTQTQAHYFSAFSALGNKLRKQHLIRLVKA